MSLVSFILAAAAAFRVEGDWSLRLWWGATALAIGAALVLGIRSRFWKDK